MESFSANSALRGLPSVHKMLEDARLTTIRTNHGDKACAQAIRDVLFQARLDIQQLQQSPSEEALFNAVLHRLSNPELPFQRVLNATGVILHTNLGRAPIAPHAQEAMQKVLGYCDLEFDLETGQRASRLRMVSQRLADITGSEAGLVVNNCAAALLLSLAALSRGGPVAISRGHLVEIGGGFRLPSILEASGCPLLEVGTTNRTHLADYEEAIEKGAKLLLVVHRSNFTISGYTKEVSFEELVRLGQAHGIPVVCDLGSGCAFDTTQYGLPEEPSFIDVAKEGFDLTCFSGDKLLGGAQGGLAVGTHRAIEAMRKHPLARALRCDKLQLAGILATLDLYARAQEHQAIPVLKMLNTDMEVLRKRAQEWVEGIGCGEVIEADEAMGGGTLPDGSLKGYALALTHPNPELLQKLLRSQKLPIIAHIHQDRILLHPRTVSPEDDAQMIAGIKESLAHVETT